MSEIAGTANIVHQFSEYNQLQEEYSPEVAKVLTQKNLARHEVFVTPDQVEGWHIINSAAADGRLDIREERRTAETIAEAATANILEKATGSSATENFADEEIENVEYDED